MTEEDNGQNQIRILVLTDPWRESDREFQNYERWYPRCECKDKRSIVLLKQILRQLLLSVIEPEDNRREDNTQVKMHLSD